MMKDNDKMIHILNFINQNQKKIVLLKFWETRWEQLIWESTYMRIKIIKLYENQSRYVNQGRQFKHWSINLKQEVHDFYTKSLIVTEKKIVVYIWEKNSCLYNYKKHKGWIILDFVIFYLYESQFTCNNFIISKNNNPRFSRIRKSAKAVQTKISNISWKPYIHPISYWILRHPIW